jgi:peptidoglycan/xylan/chitin deacetylase (PgdA/CDA1 family)
LKTDYTGGIWRLYQLLEELNFTFSLIACGRSAELAPVVVTEAVNMGAEIVASGYRYVLFGYV